MRMMALVGMAASAFAVSSGVNIRSDEDMSGVEARRTRISFQKRGKGRNNRRGDGKRSPPKSRPNRLTISKRVRRKHRRAA